MNKLTKPNLLLIITLLLGVASLGACNTVDGAGRDIENAGEAVQDAAD